MTDFDVILRSLVRDHGTPLKKLAEGLGVSSSEILNWNNRSKTKFTYSQIMNLARYLGISYSELTGGNFDGKLVRRRIHEGPLTLPEKYGACTGSRVRTSAHIIDFLKLYKGQAYCDALLLSMNIHPSYFDDLDNEISFQFFVDLLEKLQELDYGIQEFKSLARLLPMFLRGSALGNEIAKASSYEELFYFILENNIKFDRNFNYRGEISAKGVLFEAAPSDELKENWPQRRGSRYELEEIFHYRQGFLSHFSLLLGQHHLEVTPLKAISAGDDVDQYWVDFSSGFMPLNDRIAHSL